MITPTNEAVQHSLSKLEDQLNLHQADINNITWAFTFHTNQNHFLLTVNASNKKLAETLLIYQRKLNNNASPDNLELSTLIDQVFLHYIVNTDGQIPDREGADPFDVFDAATRYAATLSVGVLKDGDSNSLLKLDGREIACPEWNAVAGWSAAWSLREVGPVINRVRYGRDDVIPSSSFNFNENIVTYSLENAMVLADCAHLAYMTPNYIAQQLADWKYKSFHWVEDKDTDTQAFVVKKENHLIVCFRGTSSGRDAIMDLKFFRTQAFGGIGSVHRGFKKALDSVWDQLKEIVATFDTSKRIYVCGHSLGAALAQLAAYRLAKNGSQISGVYVYGSPRIGNRSFRNAYNQLLKEQTFLHINNQDIVTQSPPRLLGFHHLGTIPRTFDSRHNISRLEEFITEETALVFDDLDDQQQAKIRNQMEEVQNALDAATQFLHTPPALLDTGSYNNTFETGRLDEHSMDQYLFKLGCAIIDNRWEALE